MGSTMVMTHGKSAYTLTDISLFMAYKGKLKPDTRDPGRKGATEHLRGHSCGPGQTSGGKLQLGQ